MGFVKGYDDMYETTSVVLSLNPSFAVQIQSLLAPCDAEMPKLAANSCHKIEKGHDSTRGMEAIDSASKD